MLSLTQNREKNSMFVITGATGNTGSVAAKALLAAGARVRVVVRDRQKAEGLRALGAEVVVADLTDEAALERAVAGAEGVYFLSPPDMAASNFVADRKALTDRQIAAFSRAYVEATAHAVAAMQEKTTHSTRIRMRDRTDRDTCLVKSTLLGRRAILMFVRRDRSRASLHHR